MMRPPQWLAATAVLWTVLLLASILLALPAQPLNDGGSALVAFQWGRATFNNLYAVFVVIGLWISATVRPLSWLVVRHAVLAVLGNVSAVGVARVASRVHRQGIRSVARVTGR